LRGDSPDKRRRIIDQQLELVLLMDEPFSALDPLIRRKLQDELLAVQERVRKTILFVSQALSAPCRARSSRWAQRCSSPQDAGRMMGPDDATLLRPVAVDTGPVRPARLDGAVAQSGAQGRL